MSADPDFATLVHQHYGALYRFAFSLTNSEADACDLVQQTCYIWLRKGGQLRQPAKAKSWLFTTLHREFLQSRRRTHRFPEIDLDHAEHELPCLPADDWAHLDGERIAQLLQQIDATFRAPLALFYLQDTPYDDIAQILELPLGTVKSRLSRGVAQLRELLARDLAAGGKESP